MVGLLCAPPKVAESDLVAFKQRSVAEVVLVTVVFCLYLSTAEEPEKSYPKPPPQVFAAPQVLEVTPILCPPEICASKENEFAAGEPMEP